MTEATDEITTEIDPARRVMLSELYDEFGKELVDEDIAAAVQSRITQVYDNRDEIREQIESEA